MPCSCGKPGPDELCSTCRDHEVWRKRHALVSGEATLRYFEYEQLVGEERRLCASHTTGAGETFSGCYPNTAYFCPVCGNIWGRAVYEFKFDYQPIPAKLWTLEIRRCRNDGDGLFLTGHSDFMLNHTCSISLLRREAEILVLRENNHKLLSPSIPHTSTPPAAMSALSRFRRNS